MTEVSAWSQTDASNNSAAPAGAPEGMAPGGLNDTLRAVMGGVARRYARETPITTAGTSTAYTITYSVAPSSLVNGETFLVEFHTPCGAAPTGNINALGALPFHKYSATGGTWGTLAANDVLANTVARVAYNSAAGALRIIASSNVIGAVPLGGGTMTGLLTLSGDPTAALHAATKQYVDARVATGDIKMIAGNAAPAGWLECNGNTIGSGSSGGTARANADTEALFTVFWNSTANADLAIQDSTGAATTRGASASADFAANKRMPLPDFRDYFPRGKSGSRNNLSSQADAFQGHYHNIWQNGDAVLLTNRNSLGSDAGLAMINNGAGSVIGSGTGVTGPRDDSTNGTPRTATETRPKNIALMFIVKL